ncbi:bifunctional folylpolyglutamate synthase/dihydrofolate synthase [Oceanithermus sp.]
MRYFEAVRWLEAQRRAGRARGPQRATSILAALGLEGGPRLVHVVGTNGKGSVAAYLEAGFRAAGVRAGAFTSPHLVDLRERVRIGGEPVTPGEVTDFVHWARGSGLGGAFFDWMLAFALERFTARGVGWAALEAGVGGASDATMAARGVELVVLTNVGRDHLASYGGSLEALARDKTGAVRPGVPVVTAATGAGLAALEARAAHVGAPLFRYDPADPLFRLPRAPALPGRFQQTNAALAAAALRLLDFPEQVVAAALEKAHLPGRFDRRRWRGVEVVLDGAHNLDAARALAAELPRYHLVFGAQPHKAPEEVLVPLLTGARSLVFTWPAAGPLNGGAYEPEPERALALAASRAQEDGEPVLVTGSLYLVGRLLGVGLLD